MNDSAEFDPAAFAVPAKHGKPSPPAAYRCPGESYTISRAIHLGRLVQGYHGCRQCPWASDTAGLSERQVRELAAAHARPAAAPLFYDEGVRSATLDGLSAAKAAALARAWVRCVSSLEPARGDAPRFVVASDGRAATAALHAALCEGVRSCGAEVVDAGPASAACLVRAIDDLRADGGLLLGAPSGYGAGVGIKFWKGSLPVSQGALLSAIEAASGDAGDSRSSAPRRYGELIRHPAADSYLAALRPMYHALRPLRFVLGTSCRPIVGYLNDLTQQVACKMTLRDRPLARIGEQIAGFQAHFAIEIDDDGESCQVWDENAIAVSPEKLLLWIAASIKAETVVVESTISADLSKTLSALGIRTLASDPHRAAMAQAMLDHAAIIGGGASGRIWYNAPGAAGDFAPVADALQTLTFMFNLLSRSDRPLSAVLP